MTKLTIGIGEDFPVEEKAEDERSCHHRERHGRWHRWWHERLKRRDKDKKDGES